MRKLLPALALLLALPAGAATYYVDTATGSDSNPGTIGSRWATVQKCTTAASGGDTCLIYPGTYSGNFYLCGGSSHNMSGTDSAHYTIYKNATSTRPKLCRDSSCTMTMVGPANVMLGALDEPNADTYIGHACQFIRMEGMEIHGGVTVQGASGSNTVNDITITNNDFSGGCHNDGNSTLLWMQDDSRGAGDVKNIQIDHNYFHDIVTGDASGQYAFIKNFGVSYVTIEYNTLDSRSCTAGVSCVNTSRGLIDEKDTPFHDTIRFNYGLAGSNGNEFVRLAQQCGTCAGNTTETQGYDEIYGNVIVNGGIALLNFFTHDGPWTIHHNTFINAGQGGGSGNNGVMAGSVNAPGGPITELTFQDNIIAQSTVSDASLGDYGTTNWSGFSTNTFNFNSYDSGSSWRGGGTTYSTLAAWQTAVQGQGCTSCEASSNEAQFSCSACVTVSGVASRTTPCVFAAGTDTPFHLDPTASVSCRTGSSTSGERGAYGAPGATGCVGWTCGAAAPPTTVPIVTGVRLSNVKVTP